ncbi:MAG TPA: hypothetical protein VGN00_09405 [Puia sp.]|jgi:hypothetical protein
MNSKQEYKKLLEIIKKRLAETDSPARNEDVAKTLGYSRSYFSTLIGAKGKITEDHITVLKAVFSKVLDNQTPTNGDVKSFKGGLNDILGVNEERLLRLEATLEVYESAIAGLLSRAPEDFPKKVGELREEVSKVVNRRFDELERKR